MAKRKSRLSNRPLSDNKAAARCKYYIQSGEMPMSEIAEKFGFRSVGPLYAIERGELKAHIPAAKKNKKGVFTYPEVKPLKPRKAKKKKTSAKKVKAKAAPKKKTTAQRAEAKAPKVAKAPKAPAMEVKVGQTFKSNENGSLKKVIEVNGNKALVESNGRKIKIAVARLAHGSSKKGYTLVA